MENGKKVRDIDHLSSLLKEEKKKHKPLINNCYLMPDKLDEYAKAGRLFYEIHDDGLLLFCDMDDYYIMYYYIKLDKGVKLEKKEKPVVVEFHDSEQRHNKQNDEMIPYWEKSGFVHNTTVKRMACEYTEESINDLINAHETVYEVITARPEHYERIFELLYDAFDTVVNLFPTKQDLTEAMDNGEFQCIVDENGEVMCAVQSAITDKSFDMNHVVVDKKHRGKNLSWHLRKAATEKAWKKGINKRVGWVVEGNDPGIISAKKIGLDFDGRYTIQYILR